MNWEISASSWFYYKNLSRCTVTWTSNAKDASRDCASDVAVPCTNRVCSAAWQHCLVLECYMESWHRLLFNTQSCVMCTVTSNVYWNSTVISHVYWMCTVTSHVYWKCTVTTHVYWKCTVTSQVYVISAVISHVYATCAVTSHVYVICTDISHVYVYILLLAMYI